MSNSSAEAVRLTSRAGFVWGVLTIFLGAMAIASPLVSGIAVATLVGVFLLAAGIAQAIFASRPDRLARASSPSFSAPSVFWGHGYVGPATVWSGLNHSGPGRLLLRRRGLGDLHGFPPPTGPGLGLDARELHNFGLSGHHDLEQLAGFGYVARGTLVGVRLFFAGWSMIALGAIGKAVANQADAASR